MEDGHSGRGRDPHPGAGNRRHPHPEILAGHSLLDHDLELHALHADVHRHRGDAAFRRRLFHRQQESLGAVFLIAR
jgi:hypothetical protein